MLSMRAQDCTQKLDRILTWLIAVEQYDMEKDSQQESCGKALQR